MVEKSIGSRPPRKEGEGNLWDGKRTQEMLWWIETLEKATGRIEYCGGQKRRTNNGKLEQEEEEEVS